MYTIKQYSPENAALWDDFVSKSKNGTFLFYRDFMEYHADRFEDFSLMLFEGNKLVALLPAHKKSTDVYSHRGLTYGGLLTDNKPGFEKTKQMFHDLLYWLDKEGVHSLYIKQIPQFYFKKPAFETDIIYSFLKAETVSTDINAAIDFNLPFTISESKMKNFRKRAESGFHIEKGNNFSAFWHEVLIETLKSKYNSVPVHSLNEIELLYSRFTDNIVQYNIYKENNILAGLTLFLDNGVVKSQYGAATPDGEKERALDYLFISVIEKYKNEYRYFDMGTVMNADGYNKGLLKQKEELGCSVYSQYYYKIQTANFVMIS